MWAKRVFTARFDGRCPECKEPIEAGVDELVFNDDDQVIHVDCWDGEVLDD